MLDDGRRVSRDHLDAHAGGRELAHRHACRGLGWIDEGHAAGKDQSGFVFTRQRIGFRRHRAAGNAKQAQPLGSLGLDKGENPGSRRIIELVRIVIRLLESIAQREQGFGSPFDDHLPLVAPRDERRGAAPLKIEREIGEWTPGTAILLLRRRRGEQRGIEIVVQSATEAAVDAGELRHARTIGTVHSTSLAPRSWIADRRFTTT